MLTSRRVSRRAVLRAAATVVAANACTFTRPRPTSGPQRIGVLSTGAAVGPNDPPYAAFREGMRSEGLIEGTDYEVSYRFGVFDADLLSRWAREFVSMGVQVILASSTGATQAARAVSTTVPIVMVASHDPIDGGVVPNLARPGGNVTGQSLGGSGLMPIQLDYLLQITPVRRLGYLSPSLPQFGAAYPSVTEAFERRMRDTAVGSGIDMIAPKIRTVGDVKPALVFLESEQVNALFVIESPMWYVPGTAVPIRQVVDFAISRRLPTMGGHRIYADAGVLATYGDVRSFAEMHRSAARYVAAILRGTPPGDLPVEQSTHFELVINTKTASAIGLEVPQTVRALATLI